MSEGIRDLQKLNSRQLENVKRRQDREIKNLEGAHQNYKAELKKTHESEIIDIQNQNHHQVAKESSKKEKVLEEMRHHLQTTEQMTDKELKELKDMSARERANIQIKLSEDRQKINAENELYLEELGHRFQTQSKKINLEGKGQIDEMTDKLQRNYSDTEGYYQTKLNEQTNQFNERFKRETNEQKRIKDQTESQFKKERMSTNQRQQIDLAKLTTTHSQAVEVRDNEFRKGLKEQDIFFEKKYAKNLADHNEKLANLDKLHEKVMEKMKSGLAQELIKNNERSDDPFYQFTDLRPNLKQYPDRIEIQVEVPEHAKEDIQLTLNDKEAILTFNRRYTDSNKLGKTLNKVDKVETFSSRMSTDMHLDPKSVKSSYENGVMSYTVKKA
jgi:HSP20 family molecular chaperone IbpA